MTDALEDHEGTVSTGGRAITSLHLADDINGLAVEELANLVECLNKASTLPTCHEDQADDKQHQWHQHSDQSKWTEA